MPAIQTTYGLVHAPAYEGLIADSRDHDVESEVIQSAAGIGFGKPAFRGTTDRQIKNFADRVAEAFIGFTEAAHIASGGLADLYAQYENVPVMRRGVMWVMANVAVAPGDLVYFVTASGLLTNSATSATIITGATWETTTSGAGLAIVRLP